MPVALRHPVRAVVSAALLVTLTGCALGSGRGATAEAAPAPEPATVAAPAAVEQCPFLSVQEAAAAFGVPEMAYEDTEADRCVLHSVAGTTEQGREVLVSVERITEDARTEYEFLRDQRLGEPVDALAGEDFYSSTSGMLGVLTGDVFILIDGDSYRDDATVSGAELLEDLTEVAGIVADRM